MSLDDRHHLRESRSMKLDRVHLGAESMLLLEQTLDWLETQLQQLETEALVVESQLQWPETQLQQLEIGALVVESQYQLLETQLQQLEIGALVVESQHQSPETQLQQLEIGALVVESQLQSLVSLLESFLDFTDHQHRCDQCENRPTQDEHLMVLILVREISNLE